MQFGAAQDAAMWRRDNAVPGYSDTTSLRRSDDDRQMAMDGIDSKPCDVSAFTEQ